MAFYKHHVFFCLNQRDAPEACCACHGAEDMRDYAKGRVKELGLNGRGQGARQQGRLPRPLRGRPGASSCTPKSVWYTYVDKKDIDEIIDEHLVNGRVVERLRI